MNNNYATFIRKLCLPVILLGAVLCLAFNAQAFIHPCIPATLEDLNNIKASLNQEPWKSGFAILSADSHSSLNYTMQGPFGTVTRNPDSNLWPWRNDMTAVWDLSRMWYFTGNTNYAVKAHDILLAWVNTQTNFGGQESGLDLGDYAHCYAGGADILRGTWPGWTTADTVAVSNFFMNVYWPACSAGTYVPGEFNKGLLNMEAGIAIAVFCDDTNKFNHIIETYRSYPGAGLANLLPTGETGETGRDEGHVQAGLLGAAFISEVAWKQGVDLYSEDDNRLLACGEYYARNTLTLDNPFVPFGTVDYTYYANNAYYYTANRSMLYLIQNAYKNRFHLPTPWIDAKLQQQNVDSDNWMYAKTADFTTATPLTPIVRPAVSLASGGLTLTTLGSQTSGRSASYANGVWTMSGLGSGVWTDTGGSDDCQFDYQAMTGDCAMVAQVTSASYTGSQNGKIGLMIRDNLSPTVSQRAWISITPTSTGTNLVESYQSGWTETWGGTGWERRSNPLPPGLPYWLKIERLGNVVTTYSSQDGTSWAPIVSSYYGNLPSTVYIGLFICSGNTTTNTATFEHVSFTGGGGGLVTTPAAPAAVFVDGSSKAITVRWLPSFGATTYDLLRSTTSGSGYTVIASNLTTDKTSYVDTSVTTNTTYYYVVQVKNSVGTSGNSPEFYASLLPAPMVNLAFSGTSTASFNESSATEGSAKAFDGDPGSKWFGYNSPTGWLQYDFGVNNAQVVRRYTIISADVATRDPSAWNFLASQDGINWISLDSQTNQFFANRMQQNTYNIGNTTAYRYYRLDIITNNGDTGVAVAELGLWGNGGRTIPDGRYRIVSRNSNKVMDGGDISNGAPLVQQTYNGGNSQQWEVAWQGNGQYRATAVGSTNVIDNGGTSSKGANLVVQPWSGSTSQLWNIVPDSDGFFHITSANSGLVADVSGGSTADGAHIIQWTYSGANNQQWMPSLGWGTSPPPIPPAPSGLSATAVSASQINLSWAASSGATRYNVKRATTSGGSYVTIGTATGTSFTDVAVVTNQTYYYVVTALNSGGESGNSQEASATPQESLHAYLKFDETSGTSAADSTGHGWNGTLVNGPTWVAGYSNNAVNLSVASQYVTLPAGVVSNLNDFTISAWVKLTALSTWSRIFDFGTGTSTYMFLTPSCGGNNVVRFAITTGGGNGEERIDGTAALPTNVWTHVAVTLSGNTGVLYVNGVPVGTNSAMTLTPASLGVTTLNYIGKSQFNDPYLNGQVDEFRIYRTELSPGEVATLVTPLAAPVGLGATAGNGQVALSWNNVTNAVYYHVFRSLASGGPYTTIASLTATSYTDTTAVNGTTYYYVVSAVNGTGESPDSGEVSATPPPPPPATPTGLVAIAGNAQVGLIWNSSSGGTSYNVKRATVSGGPYTTVTNVTKIGYTDTGLVNGTTYYYVVSAVNAGGESGDSTEASATPLAPPAVPAGLAGVPGNLQAFLSWSPASGATSYNVKRSTTSGGSYTTVANVSTTGYTDSGLANGTTYYYVVSAVNASGESANSTEASVTPTDLFSHWTFDEGSGTTAADSGGGKNDATLQSGAGWTIGKFNDAVQFNGTSGSYATLPSGLVQTLNDFSICCWVKVDTNAAWARVFDFGSGTGAYMFLAPDSGSGTLRYAITTNSNSGEQQLNASSALPAGAWHHVAVTLSGSTGILYVDGIAVATNSNMTLNPSSLGDTTQNYLGKSQWNDPYLNGSLDDLRIYSRALSAAEISALAGANLPSPWNTTDIGSVGVAGSATYTNPVYTVTGSGADTWGASDQFRYVYQIGGTNCSITAKLLTLTTNSSAAAKGGVMVRETLATNSVMCEMQMTALNGAENLWRTSTGGNVTGTSTSGLSAPYWVRITRSGNTFTSYRSPDGVTWTQMSSTTIAMANSVYIGLYVCSHNNSALCTATFSNVTASP